MPHISRKFQLSHIGMSNVFTSDTRRCHRPAAPPYKLPVRQKSGFIFSRPSWQSCQTMHGSAAARHSQSWTHSYETQASGENTLTCFRLSKSRYSPGKALTGCSSHALQSVRMQPCNQHVNNQHTMPCPYAII